jgi:hypothetical protein
MKPNLVKCDGRPYKAGERHGEGNRVNHSMPEDEDPLLQLSEAIPRPEGELATALPDPFLTLSKRRMGRRQVAPRIIAAMPLPA